MNHFANTFYQNPFIRNVCLGALWIMAVLLLSPIAMAQNCKKLTPAGAGLDDAPQINDCLQRKGFAKLKGGTFLLYTPIVFPRNTPENPVSGVRLLGRGMDTTKLVIQSTCINHFPFVSEQERSYQSAIQAIKSPQATISGFELDLTNLRQDCNHTSNYMISVNRSPNAQVSGVRIKGSPYGDVSYTTGGANSGGILVVNSEATIISDNELKDIAFTVENGTQSAGQGGISIANSANSVLQNNRLEHIAFGLIVSNGATREGYTGDSSGTSVIGNTIIGAANIGCPNCSGGRGLKLQACGLGDEPPLDRLTVSNNNATEFGGGANGLQAGSGLDLVCGVTNSTFENNRFIGAATAEFGLQIRSSFLSVPNTSHHNKFQQNIFLSGRGTIGCNDQCADVNFTQDGPDQIGIQRNGQDRAGSNTATSFRYATDRGCSEFAHAFFLYLDGKSFVRQGDNILLAASGVRPNSPVTFTFRSVEDNRLVASYTSLNANRNCVMNQEYILIDTIKFPVGEYKVFAEYRDGNSNATISNDTLGTLLVKIAK